MTIVNRAYYSLKPFVPWSVRLTLRRWRARSVRTGCADVWPVDERAGAVPPNWPGWPGNKRFAFVLTHDVEGRKGLQRVRRLMNLESKYDFRSSFNFVPEGQYLVDRELRHTLERAGFEIGVHGLEHDGKLYDSKARFASKAVRIREYLTNWKACGFRSPMMQHRLSWLHKLNVEYDASTFDTDPFEPEPDGIGTVFPFWVPGPHGAGYVELPYTLPQDFTLFVVLREHDIEIWKQKLDWIAARGGMALLNTHPDYMCFEGKRSRDEYPISHFEAFLSYVREKYDGVFWPALPRDIARYYREHLPSPYRNSRKKICILSHEVYQRSSRSRQYAEVLAARGDQVDVITPSCGNAQAETETSSGVTLHHLHWAPNGQTRLTSIWRWARFLVASSAFLTRQHYRKRYDVIHVHDAPDILVFAAWYPKWTGAKLLLEHRDAGTARNLAKAVAAAFAGCVLEAAHLWHQRVTAPLVGSPHMRTGPTLTILVPNSIQSRQGLHAALEAFARVRDKVPDARLHLYGGGSMAADLAQLIDTFELHDSVECRDSMSPDRARDIVTNADAGSVTMRAATSGKGGASERIMEFVSRGVPVLMSRADAEALDLHEPTIHFFDSANVRAMADAIVEIIEDRIQREGLGAEDNEHEARQSQILKRSEYLELIDSLSTEIFDDPGPTKPAPDRNRE